MSDVLSYSHCPLCNKHKNATGISYNEDGSVYSNYISFSCGFYYYKYTDGREDIAVSSCPKAHELLIKMIKPSMLTML